MCTILSGISSLTSERRGAPLFIVSDSMFIALLLPDLLTVSPQSDVTEEGLIEPTDSSFTTSPTNGLSTIDANITYTDVSVTSPPAAHTDPSRFNSSHDQTMNPTHTVNTATFSDQSVSNNLSTTLSYGSTVTGNDPIPHTVHSEVNTSTTPVESSTPGNITENSDDPDATPTLGTGNVTVAENEGNNNLIFHS